MAQAKKFGTFAGVYVPSVLTILGVIMYMRMGWIVGNTSTFEFVIVVLFSHIISLTTGLSVSSIATDKKIKAGGIYYMLSRSLGLPIGGAIGLTIFVGTALSIALYLIGFSESFNVVTGLLGNSLNDYRITASITLLLITILAFISTSVAIKTQFFILIFIILSLVSIFMGEFNPDADVILTEAANEKADLSLVFAIFFPAVTGFTAGVAMSGDLKDSKKSIPYGTMLSIGTGLIIYFVLGVFLRYSIPEEYLKSDYGILLKFAAWSPLLIAGIWGATVSSALGGLLGAPRILQALSIDKITPKFFGKGVGEDNEPRNALLFTFIIAEAGILIGQLDVIAEIVSMFYLAAYGFINLACFLESWASTDFLPKFKIPKWVSLSGFFFTFIIMAYLNLIAMLVALILIGGVFIYLTRKEIALGSGDVWQSVWASLIKVALKRIHLKDEHKRNWKPNILLFSGGSVNRPHLIDFGRSVAGKNGMISNFDLEENKEAETLFPKSRQLIKDELFEQYGIFSVHQEVKNKFKAIESIAETYGFTGVEPNTVLMGWGKNTKDPIWFAQMTQRLKNIDYNILYLDYDKERGFGNRESIDIWWDHFGDSADLTLQLVKLIQKSSEWRKATVRLFVVNSNFDIKEELLSKIEHLLSNLRLDAEIKIINNYQDETQYALIESYSSETDLIFVEMPEVIKPEKFVNETNNLFKHVGTTLLVGASSHFSDVISFETKKFEEPLSIESKPALNVSSIEINLGLVNPVISDYLKELDNKFSEFQIQFNEDIEACVFSFYNQFFTLKGEELKQFVDHQKSEKDDLMMKKLNSSLQSILKRQKEQIAILPKYVKYTLSKTDLDELDTDTRREKRAKKMKRFKSSLGIKPKMRLRYQELIRFYYDYHFLPEFNKSLNSMLVDETILFWELHHSKGLNEIREKVQNTNTSFFNVSRKFINEIAKTAEKISVSSILDDLVENSRLSKYRKELRSISGFASKHGQHRSELIDSLNTESLINEAQGVYGRWFESFKTEFETKLLLPMNESLDLTSKTLEASTSLGTNFNDILRQALQKLKTRFDGYSETLSVVPKSEFIRYENTQDSFDTIHFSYLNYFELLKEQNIKSFLIEETQIIEAVVLNAQNELDNNLQLFSEEKSKDKPTKKILDELTTEIKLNISNSRKAIEEYRTQVLDLTTKSAKVVDEKLSMTYLFEHIQEVKTEVIKVTPDNGIKSKLVWVSDQAMRVGQSLGESVDGLIDRLVEKQKQNSVSENVGSVARYKSYFSSRVVSAKTKMKLPFYYRDLFQTKTYNSNHFFGRDMELELANEALENSINGVSGAIVVSGEIKSGKTTFANALLSDKKNVIHLSLSTQDEWTIKRFTSEIHDKIIEKSNSSERQIYVIDDLEFLFKNKNGAKILTELKQLIKDLSGEHTFILIMNQLFFEFVNMHYSFLLSVFINIRLQSLSIEAIHQSIWGRHAEANLSFIYNDEIEENSLTERTRRKISKNIHSQSDGNIGQAFSAWMGAIIYKNAFNLNFELFKRDAELITKMGWLLTLEKLYIHNGILIKQANFKKDLGESLSVLERSGIVYKTDTEFRIIPQALKLVKQSLEASGIK